MLAFEYISESAC